MGKENSWKFDFFFGVGALISFVAMIFFAGMWRNNIEWGIFPALFLLAYICHNIDYSLNKQKAHIDTNNQK